MSNRFINRLTADEASDLVNYVFPHTVEGTVTAMNSETSQLTVRYAVADTVCNVTADDFEGFLDVATPIPAYVRKICAIDGGYHTRFQAWMLFRFGTDYLQALARYLEEKYAQCR